MKYDKRFINNLIQGSQKPTASPLFPDFKGLTEGEVSYPAIVGRGYPKALFRELMEQEPIKFMEEYNMKELQEIIQNYNPNVEPLFIHPEPSDKEPIINDGYDAFIQAMKMLSKEGEKLGKGTDELQSRPKTESS